MDQSINYLILALTFIAAILHLFCFVINVLLTIFIISEWRKPKSIFRSSYFFILIYGYIMVIIFSLSLFSSALLGKASAYSLLIAWHVQNLLGIWDVTLGLNRCTALGFPLIHKKIWNKITIASSIILFLLFPFLLHGYAFINNCCDISNFFMFDCINAVAFKQDFLASAVNAGLGTLSLILIIIGIIKSPKTQTITIKFEKRLIFQTGFSSIISVLLSILGIVIRDNGNLHLELVAYYLYLLQFYPGMLILFVLSPALRKGFLKFYVPSWCCCCKVATKNYRIRSVSMYPSKI